MKTKVRSRCIVQNIDLGYACFQEKYYSVCIARAAVNESVCEDSPGAEAAAKSGEA